MKSKAMILLLLCSFFSCFSYLQASDDIAYLAASQQEPSKSKPWVCKSKDVPYPMDNYPLTFTQDYLVNSYYILFHVFLSEPDHLYVDALRQITFQDLVKAQQLLEKTIQVTPEYTYAYVQLGFVHLWQGHLVEAKEMFEAVLAHCPCSEFVISGLEKLAAEFERKTDQQLDALDMYRLLVHCDPDSKAYLFGMGRTLARTDQWKEAEKILKECLERAPQDSDVGIQLATLYFWQGRYDEAEALYKQYPGRIEAKEGLAKIELARGNYENAQEYFNEVTEKEPDTFEPYLNLARSYGNNLEYTKAKQAYQKLVKKFPGLQSGWAELLETKLHTDPALNFNTTYFEARENDPNLKVAVVRDYYFDTNAIMMIPILDWWRVDLKGFFDYQEEKSIIQTNPGINYNAQISGGALYSHLLFANFWKWDIFASVKRAWPVGFMFYPFQNTTRFEPGSYFSYSTERQSFSVGGNVDSFIIKNFAKVVSEFLTVKSVETRYRYTFPVRYNPEVEGWLEESYFESSPRNKRDSESASLRFFVPFIDDYFKAFYTYEHRHFNKLNPNYYSFKQQWRNTFGFTMSVDGHKGKTSAEFSYWFRLQKTKDLFQPIGSFLLITPMQFLKCNQFEGHIRFRIKDTFKADISASYYKDTLPYKVYSVQGHLFYAF